MADMRVTSTLPSSRVSTLLPTFTTTRLQTSRRLVRLVFSLFFTFYLLTPALPPRCGRAVMLFY